MRRSDFKIATDGVIGFELSERDLNARRRRVVARAGLHRERARQAQTSRLRLGLADRLFLDEKKGYLKRIKAPIKFTGRLRASSLVAPTHPTRSAERRTHRCDPNL
jgi:hypothetical protein